MARYDSSSTEVDGQYPAPAFALMGLPAQDFGTGAAGSNPTSGQLDQGSTNEPGQYPDRDSFTGVPYSQGGSSGSGAPGAAGITGDGTGAAGDTITFSQPTFYKSAQQPGGLTEGYIEDQASGRVSGQGDWTQANTEGYQAAAQYQMPGVAGNTPAPGDSGRFQTEANPTTGSSAHVLYGGFLNGSRPGTSQHPGFSGPGS